MKRKLYQQIASLLEARENCAKRDNLEWFEKHGESLEELNQELPQGSGFDVGSTIDLIASKPDKIILHTSYHFMDSAGFYKDLGNYKIIITPSLAHDKNIRIVVENIDHIK